MKYHLISAALILAAMLLFLFGISLTETSYFGPLLIIAAAVCEFRFWKRAFIRHHDKVRQ